MVPYCTIFAITNCNEFQLIEGSRYVKCLLKVVASRKTLPILKASTGAHKGRFFSASPPVQVTCALHFNRPLLHRTHTLLTKTVNLFHAIVVL